MPLPVANGIKLANSLQARHDKVEAALRSKAFDDARLFMRNAAAHGGVAAHTAKSFLVRGDRHGRRVDIEVQSGMAFV